MCGVCARLVGDGLTLSESYEAIISTEFRFTDVRRSSTLADVDFGEAPRSLLVIEEQVFWADPEGVLRELDRFKNWQVALAYNDVDIATRFYAGVRERRDFHRFSLLPMNVQLDCWVAIFRILLLGQSYLPAAVVQRIIPETPMAESVPESPLTSREQEILVLASKGKQNKSIAFDLGVSEHTVKLHMHHIIKKLGVHNRTEAVGEYLQGFPNQQGA